MFDGVTEVLGEDVPLRCGFAWRLTDGQFWRRGCRAVSHRVRRGWLRRFLVSRAASHATIMLTAIGIELRGFSSAYGAAQSLSASHTLVLSIRHVWGAISNKTHQRQVLMVLRSSCVTSRCAIFLGAEMQTDLDFNQWACVLLGRRQVVSGSCSISADRA